MRKLRSLCLCVLLSFSGFVSAVSISYLGNSIVINLTDKLNLTSDGNGHYWTNSDKYITLHISELPIHTKSAIAKEKGQLEANLSTFLIDENEDADGNTLLVSRELHNGTAFRRHILLGGDISNTFKVTLAYPETDIRLYEQSTKEMLNSVQWQPRISPIFEDMPFTLKTLNGFTIKSKYRNSVVLKSNTEISELDAFLIISSIERTLASDNLEKDTLNVFSQTKNLSGIKIKKSLYFEIAEQPVFSVKASGYIEDTQWPVDIVMWGFYRKKQFIVFQVMVDKTSTSFMQLEDLLRKTFTHLEIK